MLVSQDFTWARPNLVTSLCLKDHKSNFHLAFIAASLPIGGVGHLLVSR